MVLLLLAFIPLLVLVQDTTQEIQRTKHISNATTNFADSLRLRDILADERYAALLKDLRSPIRRHHNQQHRQKRAASISSATESFDIDFTTPFAIAARKNTKRTKNEKKTTKFGGTTIQTSTPAFTPSKSSSVGSNGKVKVSEIACSHLFCIVFINMKIILI